MFKTTAQRQKQSITLTFFRSEIQVEIQFLLVAFAVCPAVDFFLVYVFTVVGADRERGFRLK